MAGITGRDELVLGMGDEERTPGQGTGVAVEEAKPRVKRPPSYRVIMLNDDFTPMEFVVHVLQRFFGKDLETATHIMLTVHTRGKAVCGVFPRDIAETKAAEVNSYSRENQHPLLCEVEAVDDGEKD